MKKPKWPDQMLREAQELSRRLSMEREAAISQIAEEFETDFMRGIRDLKHKPVGPLLWALRVPCKMNEV